MQHENLHFSLKPSLQRKNISVQIKHFHIGLVLLPPATKLGQGYIFTGVCHSVNGGGSASVHAGIPTPLEQTPPRSRHPPEQTPPGTMQPPPGTEHAGRYGECAGGTHLTGMQSCF